MFRKFQNQNHRSPPNWMSLFVICAICLTGGTGRLYAETKIFEIDADRSYVHVYTGTDGWMKSVSHKHLISLGNIHGTVSLDGADSLAELQFVPGNFLVDNDEDRQKATDSEYRGPVAGWIKTGTKKNMNGRNLLEADIYPLIEVKVRLKELVSSPVFLVEVVLKTKTYEFEVPGSLLVEGNAIQASGEFELNHGDLGLSPFTVPGGLSKVADELRFVFDIVGSMNPLPES